MPAIEMNKELFMENCLCLKKSMTQEEIIMEMMEIDKYLRENNISKSGPIVTSILSMEQNNGQPSINMEINVPIDREINLPEKYQFKKNFYLKDTIFCRHEGNPNLLQNTHDEMLKFLQTNQMKQTTPIYNVNVKEIKPGDSLDSIIIDVYIGVAV